MCLHVVLTACYDHKVAGNLTTGGCASKLNVTPTPLFLYVYILSYIYVVCAVWTMWSVLCVCACYVYYFLIDCCAGFLLI